MAAREVYLVSWSGYGHPEWNSLMAEGELRELLKKCEERGWVRPDVYRISVDDAEIYIDILAKCGLCGATPDIIKSELERRIKF